MTVDKVKQGTRQTQKQESGDQFHGDCISVHAVSDSKVHLLWLRLKNPDKNKTVSVCFQTNKSLATQFHSFISLKMTLIQQLAEGIHQVPNTSRCYCAPKVKFKNYQRHRAKEFIMTKKNICIPFGFVLDEGDGTCLYFWGVTTLALYDTSSKRSNFFVLKKYFHKD